MLHSPLVIVVFGLVLVKSDGLQVNIESSSAFTQSSDTFYPEYWISDLFHQALVNFTVRNVGNSVCQKQAELYEKNLRNYTNWAVKISESWDRRPIGILAGNRYHFGIYDECVGVRYPIKGQYCIAEVKLRPTVENNNSSNKKDNLERVYNSHAWKTILEWNDYPDLVQRNVLNLGICIPDSCSASDLQISLQIELNKIFLPEKINAIVKVEQIMCTVKEDKYPYDTAFYVTCAILGLLVTICCTSTVHHYLKLSYNQNKTEASENLDSYFYSFSIIKSIQDLLKYNKDDELNCFHGFKFILMLFVLFGHRFFYFAGSPLDYAITLEDIYTSGPDILLTGMNVVDQFFFFSGFLSSFKPAFNKFGPVWTRLAIPIINRIVRILPAYCAMIAITAHLMPHLGDGPLWPRKIWEEADNCKNYWWANVLFISNLINIKYQCLIVSWYLSCDIQYYVIGILMVYVYTKSPKHGSRLVITVLSLSFLVPIIVMFLMKSDGFLKIDIPFLENMRSSVIANEMFRSSYLRSSPYFMGLTMGFLITKLKNANFKVSQTAVYGGTFVVTVISIWLQLYGAKLYTRHRPYYPLESVIYSVLSHCTWPMIAAWGAICHFTTGYGLLMQLISNRICVVMGKLSYSVMLVNFTVIIMSQSSQKSSYHLSIKSMLDAWIHDSFKSYLMGLMLYIIVEAPFGNIWKKLYGRWKQEKIAEANKISVLKY